MQMNLTYSNVQRKWGFVFFYNWPHLPCTLSLHWGAEKQICLWTVSHLLSVPSLSLQQSLSRPSSECHPSSISNNVSCSVATMGGATHILLWIFTGHRAKMSIVPCLALRALMRWGCLQLVSCQSVLSGLDQNQVERPLAQTPLGLFALLRDWICLRLSFYPRPGWPIFCDHGNVPSKALWSASSTFYNFPPKPGASWILVTRRQADS